jgi:hypothetical protein
MNDDERHLSESLQKPDVGHLDMPEVELFFQHLDSFSIEMRRMFKEMNATLVRIGENLDLMNSKLDRCSAGIQASLESFMR